jgi:two-component system sensor histidine kinase BaeS
MARLLDDLSTLSTAEAGALRLQREVVDPAVLVSEVIAASAPAAAQRRVELSSQIGRLPELEADPVRLRQVLDNLVANAVRYSAPGGSVRIVAHVADGETEFPVEDNGPGIAPDDLPHLFGRFSKSADSKGSGFGLAIAKSLVESHGGLISARSEPHQGTTITFRLPLGEPLDDDARRSQAAGPGSWQRRSRLYALSGSGGAPSRRTR